MHTNQNLCALYQDPGVDLQLLYIEDKIIKFDRMTIDDFVMDGSTYKIAAVQINYLNVESTRHLISRLRPYCDLLLIKSMEMTSQIFDLVNDHDFHNMTFVLNGFGKFTNKQSTIDDEMFWLTTTANPYYHQWIDIIKDRLCPFTPKPFFFDVLYGTPKAHRLFLRSSISQFDNQPWFYQSTFFKIGLHDINSMGITNNDFWDEEIVATYDDQNVMCQYRGHVSAIGTILPYKVYQKTAYSLVCETNYSSSFTFFTEKIAKPILAFRLFIVLAGPHYLENLRRLGFQTFDTIIDESYDDEQDDNLRWTMAINQALWLCNQSQEKILEKAVPIVLHNHRILKNLKSDVSSYHVQKFLLSRSLQSGG